MSFNHKFLATKSWNVHNVKNQMAVAAAEAQQATLQKRVEERRRTLDRERERQQSLAQLSERERASGRAVDAAAKGVGSSVAFLYEPPPGFTPAYAPPAPTSKDELAELHDLTKAEKDADAKPAAGGSSSHSHGAAASATPLPFNAPPTRLPGADGSLPPEETHEERRARHRGMSVQAIREELHPALRGAPVTAPHVRQMNITAKPLGILLRDMRCLRCGGIGHSSTDRECPRFNDVTGDEQSRRVREDPLTKLHAIAPTAASSAAAANAAPGAVSGTGSGVAGGKAGQFKLLYNDEAYTAGGLSSDHPLQQVLIDDDEEDAAAAPQPTRSSRRTRAKLEDAVAASAHAASASAHVSSTVPSALAALASSSLSAADASSLYASLPSSDVKLLIKQLKRARGARITEDDSDTDEHSRKRAKDDKKQKKRKHKVRTGDKEGHA
jgi:CBF1 interacting corepressor